MNENVLDTLRYFGLIDEEVKFETVERMHLAIQEAVKDCIDAINQNKQLYKEHGIYPDKLLDDTIELLTNRYLY